MENTKIHCTVISAAKLASSYKDKQPNLALWLPCIDIQLRFGDGFIHLPEDKRA